MLALASKLFGLAEEWGIRADGSNPCRRIKKYKEKPRERYLSADELARLGGVLRDVERERVELPSVVPAIRRLLFTGARLGEILTLAWEHVDLERQLLLLPDSKTGAKAIHLNPGAMQVLASLPREESTWVIRGKRDGACLINLEKPWRRIRERAPLEDVRLHDLRHSFPSVGAARGASLPMIGALLGHEQPLTTARSRTLRPIRSSRPPTLPARDCWPRWHPRTTATPAKWFRSRNGNGGGNCFWTVSAFGAAEAAIDSECYGLLSSTACGRFFTCPCYPCSCWWLPLPVSSPRLLLPM